LNLDNNARNANWVKVEHRKRLGETESEFLDIRTGIAQPAEQDSAQEPASLMPKKQRRRPV
jgi:hypothetical protein